MFNEKWFHGADAVSSRAEAESVLREHGFAEGLFLVRESTSADGDYVLSVVHRDEVIHYQIRKRGQDALFSLSEEKKVIHGLDELVYYYRHNPNSGLQHSLGSYIEGDFCPSTVRLHGRENLLHRATAEGNEGVVQEMLKCGYRNLAAKNHDGQSAVHLASFFGHVAVLQQLIRFGASVNVTDSSGYSPLHFACQASQAAAARLLLDVGRANPTARNQITGWVPLHEAAWKNHLECVQVLLEWKAPTKSRTPKNETPADLARANGHHALAQYIDTFDVGQAAADQKDWLHLALGRDGAVKLLNESGSQDGTFLIRKSTKRKGVFVLSMFHDWKTYHFEIVKQGIYYFLDQGPYLPSLPHLVDHYTRFSDGLPCQLSVPVASPKEPVPPRIPQRQRNTAYPTNLKAIDTNKLYENNETLRRVRHSKDNIPREAIQIGQVIGEGEFGSVFEGRYMCSTKSGQPTNEKLVAIKVLNTMEHSQTEDFLQEAEFMMKLDHQCIVQMIGVSRGPTIMMLLELVPLGSLLSYLHDHPESVQTNQEIPLWAAQIACGMMYLESEHFIHRDLAARNILLASKYQAKISDFGLSRMVGEKDYYQATKGGRWPIKWYAPESVNYGTFTHYSDVWSFGVLLWEMYSYGQQPFDSMTGTETVKFLESGQRLPRPEQAELEVFQTILWCWEYKPEDRPSFSELFKIFSENPEYLNMRELLQSQDFQELGM